MSCCGSTLTRRPMLRPSCSIPSQTLIENEDGSLTVQFRAGGLNEMCWHLFTWGTGVTVAKPIELRERLRHICADLAEHHANLSEPIGS